MMPAGKHYTDAYSNNKMPVLQKFKTTIILTLVTPVALFISFFLAGGGHGSGSYVPFIMAFPWGTMPLIWVDRINDFFQFVTYTQFIVYGLLIDLNSTKRKQITQLILASHIALAILVLIFRSGSW